MSETYEKLDVIESIENLTEDAIDELTNGDREYEVMIDCNEVYEESVNGKDEKSNEQ